MGKYIFYFQREDFQLPLWYNEKMEELKSRAQNIKLIFFDIDDTLRTKATGFMPATIPQVFERLHAKGIMTGVATGRNLQWVVPEVRALKADFYVTINGAVVEKENGEVLYKNPLDKALCEEIIAWLKSENSDYAFVAHEQIKISKWTEFSDAAIFDAYGRLEEDEKFYQKDEIYQIVSFSEHDGQLKLPEALAKKVRLVPWHRYASDIVPISGSKAMGAEQVAQQLGLKADEVMNFGDALNDRELFDYAGLSVAMQKSQPEILAKADYVTDTVENDGILKALEKLEII